MAKKPRSGKPTATRNNLKEFWTKEGLSRAKLASASGVAVPTVRRIEHGEQSGAPTRHKILKGLNSLSSRQYSYKEVFPNDPKLTLKWPLMIQSSSSDFKRADRVAGAGLCIIRKEGGVSRVSVLVKRIDQLFAARTGVQPEDVTNEFIRRRLAGRDLKEDDTNQYGGRTPHWLRKLTRHEVAGALKAYHRTVEEARHYH